MSECRHKPWNWALFNSSFCLFSRNIFLAVALSHCWSSLKNFPAFGPHSNEFNSYLFTLFTVRQTILFIGQRQENESFLFGHRQSQINGSISNRLATKIKIKKNKRIFAWRSANAQNMSFLISSQWKFDLYQLDWYQSLVFVLRAIFKWLLKLITWLRLLRLMIGLKDSGQFFSQWEAKPKPIAACTRDFSRALSRLQVILLGIVIGSSRCLLLLWLVGVIALVLVFRQSFENHSN